MRGRVLVVAGSDSGGGAGIQADIKTILALGAHASTAVTALTAQDTLGVHGIHPVPAAFVAQQMIVVLRDIGADVVKTGMLGDAALIEMVCETLDLEAAGTPVVVDPVMVAKGGAVLLPDQAIGALRALLLPRAALLTPNAPEAAALSRLDVEDETGMHRAAEALLRLGASAVLVKGAHLPGDAIVDILATAEDTVTFRSARIATRHTHGTGCTLASAVAAGLSQGMNLISAVTRARQFVAAAIHAAPQIGHGHGPLGHDVTLLPERLAMLAAS